VPAWTQLDPKLAQNSLGQLADLGGRFGVALIGALGIDAKQNGINVSRGIRRVFSTRPSADDAHGALVRVIAEAVRTLPTKHFEELRGQLEDIWGQ
jgi:hypothetical protein